MKKPEPQFFCKNNNPLSLMANCCNRQTFFIACFCFCFGFLASSNSYAQESKFLAHTSFQLKREDLSWGNRLNDKSTNKIDASFISSRILKNFNKSFKNVNTPNWYLVDKFFYAYFSENGIKSTACFNKNGGIMHTIRYGTEKDLPYEAKKMLKVCYYDYYITAATEVSEEWDKKTWIINLANNEKLIKLRIKGGELVELENFYNGGKNNQSTAKARF